MTKVTRYNPLFHDWFEGRPYNYGDEPPRYPVPATLAHVASYDYGRLGLFDLIASWRYDAEYERDNHFQ